ncbi:hypothetical protein TcG_08853, partial [Trypanosoma cruzi]
HRRIKRHRVFLRRQKVAPQKRHSRAPRTDTACLHSRKPLPTNATTEPPLAATPPSADTHSPSTVCTDSPSTYSAPRDDSTTPPTNNTQTESRNTAATCVRAMVSTLPVRFTLCTTRHAEASPRS